MKNFWIEHQRFLLLCGGVFLVFLISTSYLDDLAGEADRRYRDCGKLQKRIAELHRDLKQSYWNDIRLAEALENHEEAVRTEICLPADRTLEPSKSLLLDFNRKIEAVWAAAEGEARRRGIALPERLTSGDFGIDSTHGPGQFAAHTSALDVVHRSLLALVRSGMTRIEGPDLYDDEISEIEQDGEVVGEMLYRKVSWAVSGPYESFVDFLGRVQTPKSFLQVRVHGLKAERTGRESNRLRATLDVCGLRQVAFEAADESATASPADDKIRQRRR